MVKLGLSPEILQVTLAASWQLAVVVIIFYVTSRTLLARASKYPSRAVARLAIGQQMNTDEFHILVEVSSIHRFPAVLRVTTRTLRTVGAFMRIGVTRRAIFGFHFREIILTFRAFAASHELFTRRRVAGCALHF